MNKKAYGVASILVVLVIMSLTSILALNKYHEINLDKYFFINDYLYMQSCSIKDKEENDLNNIKGHSISFNKDGKVNMAQTIDFNNGNVVIHLGSGYLTYE